MADWTTQKVFSYYQDTFKKIYGDLVAVQGSKPLEISFELEAALSHLGVVHTTQDPKLVKENLAKAAGHLQRATLDAAKMLWLAFRQQLQPVMDDRLVRQYCVLLPQGEFVRAYQKAQNLALNARRREIENVGIDPTESVASYYEAANEFRNLLDKIDWERVASMETFRFWYIVKQNTTGFIMGVLSSTVVAVAAWAWLPPPAPEAAAAPGVAEQPKVTGSLESNAMRQAKDGSTSSSPSAKEAAPMEHLPKN